MRRTEVLLPKVLLAKVYNGNSFRRRHAGTKREKLLDCLFYVNFYTLVCVFDKYSAAVPLIVSYSLRLCKKLTLPFKTEKKLRKFKTEKNTKI
jgi:hypothetical protein